MLKKIADNRYKIMFMVFIAWFGFIDSFNVFDLYKMHKEKSQLIKDKNYYLVEIEKSKEIRHNLFSNQENLEKFAREQYLMKKDDEDIFVIIEEK